MFLNWVMLAGVGGAVVPLVLHLLARARYRNIDWGAMMFLEGVDPRQASSARLRQWLLLGLRMGLVAILAMALAQPVVRGRLGAMGQEGQITAVVVLDCSYSMGVEEAGRTRFEKAKEAVRQVLWGLGRGSEVSLVVLGDRVEVLHHDPTSNLQAVARDLDSVQVSGSSADFAAGLAAAREILDRPSRTNRELYLVTDRQAENWKQIDPAAPYLKWIAHAKPPTRFYVVPVGGEDADNVAIEAVDLVDPVAIKGLAAEVDVRVRNYAPTLRAGMEMTINDGGRKLKTVLVSVPGKAITTVRVQLLPFETTGSHVLIAQINAPGLEADNRFETAIDVIDPIQVLIVSGDETGPPAARESFFLKLALSPLQSVRGKLGDPAIVTVKSSQDWTSANLNAFPVIILLNVPQITPDEARALEQRVYEGGGLIVSPGSLSRIDNYNAVLYRGGLGLLPARLEPPTPSDGSRATGLLGVELRHPIFRFRRGSDPLPTAVIGRYFPAVPRQADAVVLSSYSSGDPFLIEGPRGKGRVLLLTTPLDADWSTLPLSSFYLPFAQSMVRYACAPSVAPRNLAQGEPLLIWFDEPVERADLFRADEKPINLVGSRGSNQVRFADTFTPGVYRLRVHVHGQEKIIHFVVQAPHRESDLTPLSDEQWRTYGKSMHFARLDPAQGAIGPVLAADRGGRELWLVLLVLAMMLGVLELGLARFWSGAAS
jgi:hypothetical protein